MQEYLGADGPATETLDGTYLLKAGLEEQMVVLWLNYITNYICAHEHSVPLPSFWMQAHQVGPEGVYNACHAIGQWSHLLSCIVLGTLICS